MGAKPAYLIDLDGTLYAGARALPGAAAFLSQLREEGRRYLLVTNCPSRTADGVVQRLAGLGIQARREDVLTSGMAAAEYLVHSGVRRAYLVGGDAAREELETRGITVAEAGAECVLVGWDTAFSYEKLRRAAALVRGGARLVATNPDPSIPGTDGPVPHTGALCAAIECAAGCRAEVLGKPGPEIARQALKKLGAAPEETVMVGDTLDIDMAFAKRNGMRGALVLTGMTARSDLAARQAPPLVFAGLPELAEWDRAQS